MHNNTLIAIIAIIMMIGEDDVRDALLLLVAILVEFEELQFTLSGDIPPLLLLTRMLVRLLLALFNCSIMRILGRLLLLRICFHSSALSTHMIMFRNMIISTRICKGVIIEFTILQITDQC